MVPSVDDSTPKDVPPIITFPEFVIRPSGPPSLLNPQTVIDTLYVAAGVAVSMYGIGQYVVAPMSESLTRARHSLAQTALENIRRLNSDLEAMVSVIPILPVSAMLLTNDGHDDHAKLLLRSETSSDSDPTELFHLDAGTQTTPSLSRATSLTTHPSPPQGIPPVDTQTGRLREIRSQLAEMVEAGDGPAYAEALLTASVRDLDAYLDTLNHRGRYQATPPFFGPAVSRVGDDDDALSTARTEIRSIKSSLLSARNFPDGVVGGPQILSNRRESQCTREGGS